MGRQPGLFCRAGGGVRLGPGFFSRDVVTVARALVGCVLAREVGGQRRAGRIVEVEAYLAAGDAAAHSARGRRDALAALAAGPGTLYIHPMRRDVGMDITALGGSVLIRALVPLTGLAGPCDGPGKVCRALGVTRPMQGLRVTEAATGLWVEEGAAAEVMARARVGLTRSAALPLRFCDAAWRGARR